VSASNGQTMGAFQRVEWALIKEHFREPSCRVYNRWTTAIIDPEPHGLDVASFDLWGSRTTTDADDATSVFYDGSGGVTFDSRYRSRDERYRAEAGSGFSVQTGTSQSRVFTIGGSVAFARGAVSLESIRLINDQVSEVMYTYTFDAYDSSVNRSWRADVLGGGQRAFCYENAVRC
jgi:hypothetical protein